MTTRETSSLGKQIRLNRLFNATSGRSFIVPMDHSVAIGPLGPAGHTDSVVGDLGGSGVNAVVLHKGRVRTVAPRRFTELALIVHLSASTDFGPDTTAKVLVGEVAEALRIGADAVSVHINIGSLTESRQLADLAHVAAECDRFGMPLLAMMYARGAAFEPGGAFAGQDGSIAALSHLAAVATDLGADLVKLPWAGSVAAMREVVANSPLPVYVAGGEPKGSLADVATFTSTVLDSGVAGLTFGRTVFAAPSPRAVARSIARLVHQPPTHLVAVSAEGRALGNIESERPQWTA